MSLIIYFAIYQPALTDLQQACSGFGAFTCVNSSASQEVSVIVIGWGILALLSLVGRCLWVARVTDRINAGGTITAKGAVSPGFIAGRSLGAVVEGNRIPSKTRKALHLTQENACVVIEVNPIGAARFAGVMIWDTILTCNGVPITSASALNSEMTRLTQTTAPGTATVALKVIRRDADGFPALHDLTLTF